MNELEKISDYDPGITMQEALAETAKRKLRLPNNLELDARLQGNEWEKEKELYPCWTGTLIVYELPGKEFGKTVSFEGLIFNVPKSFQGKKDMAIVCNHPDFLIIDNTITPGKSAVCVPFPKEDGWYIPEKQFGIPNGEKSSDNGQARYLWRRTSSSYIGLVVRYVWWGGLDRRFVYCDSGPGRHLGVAGIKGKYTQPKHKHKFVCRICGVSK